MEILELFRIYRQVLYLEFGSPLSCSMLAYGVVAFNQSTSFFTHLPCLFVRYIKMIKSVYVDTVIAKQMSEEGEAESQYSEISDSFSDDPNSTYNFSLNQNNVYLQSSFRREQVWNQLSFFFLSTDVGLLLEFIVSPQIPF